MKTVPNKRKSVKKFLSSVEDEAKRADCLRVLELMKKVAKAEPVMWGDAIVGFGTYDYKYESGREGTWFLTGFSPRKQNVVLYIMPGFSEYDELMGKLGKFKTGKSCLYIKRLQDVDWKTLEKLVKQSVTNMQKRYA